jgi:hypothetical protein
MSLEFAAELALLREESHYRVEVSRLGDIHSAPRTSEEDVTQVSDMPIDLVVGDRCFSCIKPDVSGTYVFRMKELDAKELVLMVQTANRHSLPPVVGKVNTKKMDPVVAGLFESKSVGAKEIEGVQSNKNFEFVRRNLSRRAAISILLDVLSLHKDSK